MLKSSFVRRNTPPFNPVPNTTGWKPVLRHGDRLDNRIRSLRHEAIKAHWRLRRGKIAEVKHAKDIGLARGQIVPVG